MSEPIFLRRKDGTLSELHPREYDSEAVLQALLADHPRLLVGFDARGTRRLLLVAKEAQLADSDDGNGRWSVDHLFIDDAGVPMIVEVKCSSDTRIRREVVGQMLDYAANAVLYWPIERLHTMFSETCARNNVDPDVVLQEHLGHSDDIETFWQNVSTNLQAGRIRLVFVADRIPSELQRIIEFLNGQMTRADVLGVEVRHYESDDGQVLAPSFIGQTAIAERTKTPGGRPKRQWDEASFLAEIEQRSGVIERRVAERLLDWCRPRFTRIDFGTGAIDGSFIPVVDIAGKPVYTMVVYTSGRVEIQFQYLVPVSPFDDVELRREIQRRLNEINGVTITDDRLTKRPSIQLSQLRDEKSFQTFVDAIDWILAQLATAR